MPPEALRTHETGSDGCRLSRSTAGEHGPDAAPAVAGAAFMMVYSWFWEGTLAPTSRSSVLKASTDLDFSCSHSNLADLVDLLVGRVGG
jgi:hypothetical protein